MSHENVELARRALQAFNDRDLETVLAGLHEDVEAFPRLAAVEDGYRGHDGVRRWWAQVIAAFPDFHVGILDVGDLENSWFWRSACVAAARRATRRSMPPSGT